MPRLIAAPISVTSHQCLLQPPGSIGWVIVPTRRPVPVSALQDIAEGMAFLHTHGILHADMSGNNILLASDPVDPRGFVAKVCGGECGEGMDGRRRLPAPRAAASQLCRMHQLTSSVPSL